MAARRANIVMSFFKKLGGALHAPRVRGVDEHPSWLLRSLLRARLRPHRGDTLLLIVEAEDRIGSHQPFAGLAPRLVLEDGREVPLAVIGHTRLSGFPVRCIARPAVAGELPASDRARVRSLKLSWRGETKELPVITAEATDGDGA